MGQVCSCFDGVVKSTGDSKLERVGASSASAESPPALVAEPKEARGKPLDLDLEDSSSHGEEPSSMMFTRAQLGSDGLPSQGSAGHETGECKRCAFFPKDRCQNGHACKFCHFDHEAGKRSKKKKASSALSTPISSATGSFVFTPASMSPSPMTIGIPPCSPLVTVPPPVPSSLAEVSRTEQVAPAPTGTPKLLPDEAAARPSAAAIALPPLEMPEVTIDDLFRMNASQAADIEAQFTEEQLQQQQHYYWMQQYYAANPDDWLCYESPSQYDYAAYYATQCVSSSDTNGHLGVEASLLLPSPSSGVGNLEGYGLSTSTQPLTMGYPGVITANGKESPRSVVLALCGAWGALQPTKASDKPVPRPLSRDEILSFRNVVLDCAVTSKSKTHLDQAASNTIQPPRVAAKRGSRGGGARRGRAS